jgi:hypothetical protein
MLDLNQAIEQAKLEYISDISFGYRFESQFLVVDFYQDENGKNHVEEFCKNHKGLWVAIEPTEEQVKRMFEILNNTPYIEVEPEEFREADNYDNCGVRPEHFY